MWRLSRRRLCCYKLRPESLSNIKKILSYQVDRMISSDGWSLIVWFVPAFFPFPDTWLPYELFSNGKKLWTKNRQHKNYHQPSCRNDDYGRKAWSRGSILQLGVSLVVARPLTTLSIKRSFQLSPPIPQSMFGVEKLLVCRSLILFDHFLYDLSLVESTKGQEVTDVASIFIDLSSTSQLASCLEQDHLIC